MSTQPADNTENIFVFPETDDRHLCVSFRGRVTKDEYERLFYNPMKEMVENGYKFGLLINYEEGYQGWDEDAANLSFQSIIDFGKHARKLAYVNPPETKVFQVKMSDPLLSGEIKFFNADELDEALKWVTS